MPEKTAAKASRFDELAQRLEDARAQRRTIAPLSESEHLESEADAYAIQTRATALRCAAGDRVIGRKIGLTSLAMQAQLGVTEPDYGSLLASRFYASHRGRASLPTEEFLQPRIEGEFAYLLGLPLRGPFVTPQEVLAATEAVSVSFEIIDSRITDWRIRLADTVADNASYGALTLGPWSRALRDADLRTVGMLIDHNGARAVESVGAAVLGNPPRAVAWLANKLHTFGLCLEAGDIVLSGSLGPSIPAGRGDVFTVEVHGQPPLSVVFD
jgi:2-keto-4-pentenoate hydratase